MRSLVVYDSNFGNTYKIAETIAGVLNAELKKVTEIQAEQLFGLNILIVGSPTNAWTMTRATKSFIEGLDPRKLIGLTIAAFDTDMGKWYAGNAAKKIQKRLRALGFEPIIQPEQFIVLGREGPLKEGEIERAKDWAMKITTKFESTN